MKYVGLDVHLRTSTCCILDERGRQIKTKTIPGPWRKMADYLAMQEGPITVCFEASCGYGMIHDHLVTFCQRVVVAHPGRVRLIFKAKRKNDRFDAQKLAKLLYFDEVPEVHVPNIGVRAWRELIEMRQRRVQHRTRIKNNIRALMRSYSIYAPRDIRVLWTKRGRVWFESIDWPTPVAAMRGRVLLAEWDHAEQMLETITEELDRIAGDHPGVVLLRTIPGVGPRTAEAVIAYIDDPARFSRINRVAAYAGLVPCQHSSGGTERFGRITKEGPSTMRYLLVEAAWQVIRRDPFMLQYFERIKAGQKDNTRKAIVATAHKLLRCMASMLRSGETWNPQNMTTAVASRAA